MIPTTCWLWLRMARADLLGTKPCSAMTCSTRSRVACFTLGSWLSTRETVDLPTPERRAISRMVSFLSMNWLTGGSAVELPTLL